VTPDKPASTRYQGDFVTWSGGCVFLGTGGAVVSPHSHYAIQLVIGAPTGLRVQSGRGAWQPCAAALVPSRALHSIDVSDCEWTFVIFVEPETPEGKALSARLRGDIELLERGAVTAATERLTGAWRADKSAESVKAACLQLVHELSGTAPREPSDPRVLAAIEHIRQRPDQAVSLKELAEAAHLSPSRFRHLFVAETGMPLRTYLLWRRLLRVWALLMQGETLSAAAHAAGFADSAHLSRTSRTMFGLAPSSMQMNGPLSARVRVPQHYLG
jgi:AraC-like DNA-binding protein